MTRARTRNSKRLDMKIIFDISHGRTKSEFKDSCDINYILDRYQKSGTIPLMKRKPIYDDFTNVGDYQESLGIIIEAENQFNNLPSDVRKKFENDPSKFLEFVADENNQKEMVKMGIAEAPVVVPDLVDSNEPQIQTEEV